ncbi:MAG TPA: hypothetical protein VI056_12825 [Candidatus Limnocylindria bacterium]
MSRKAGRVMDSSVAIAAAYLQLNGFFVLTELPVQVADRQGYRAATELDVLAVRLPHAAELLPGKGAHARDLLLGRDPTLETDPWRTEVLIAEVKRGRAQINEGYHDTDVLRFALRRTGCCPTQMLATHAAALAREGVVETITAASHPCRIRIAAFAGSSASLARGVLAIDLSHCVHFIRERLARYEMQLRGAYFRDPVLNLLGLVDVLSAVPDLKAEKESVHAS